MNEESLKIVGELKALKKMIAELTEKERCLRAKLIELECPDAPVEGSVKKGEVTFKFGLRRTVDEAEFDIVAPKLTNLGVDVYSLMRLKHELNLRAYRGLTDEQRKWVDRCLVSKPSLPSVEFAEEKK